MASKTAKSPVAIDTSAGEQAYALATEHRALLEARLPSRTIEHIGADLKTLGVSVSAARPDGQAAPGAAQHLPARAPLALPEALAKTANLVTAIHDAVRGARPKPEVRKAYGAWSKAVGKEVKPVLAAAERIVARATAHASEAMVLGILPADVTELEDEVADLKAAEELAEMHGNKSAPTLKTRRAAEKRMLEAVGRIAGAGVLAFAQHAAIRAQFEALKPQKQA